MKVCWEAMPLNVLAADSQPPRAARASSPVGQNELGSGQELQTRFALGTRDIAGTLLALLAEAGAQGKLHFRGPLTALADPTRLEAWLRQLPKKWVVYAKPPFGGRSRC